MIRQNLGARLTITRHLTSICVLHAFATFLITGREKETLKDRLILKEQGSSGSGSMERPPGEVAPSRPQGVPTLNCMAAATQL